MFEKVPILLSTTEYLAQKNEKTKNPGNIFDSLYIFQAITFYIKQMSEQNIVELLGAVSFRVKYIRTWTRAAWVQLCLNDLCQESCHISLL